MRSTLFLPFLIITFISFSTYSQFANDLTFNFLDNGEFGDLTGFNGPVYGTSVFEDSTIIAVGNFTEYNGFATNANIVKLQPNGAIDPNFQSNSGFNGEVMDALILPDESIILVGWFTEYDGQTANRVIRLNSNGTIDPTFITGTGADNPVLAVDTNSLGEIFFGGRFGSYNGISCNNICKVMMDGSLDPSFVHANSVGFGSTGFKNMHMLSNDQIMIGGGFTNYAFTGINGAIRLNSDGTHDASFDPQLGNASTVYDFEEYNSYIYIAGDLDGAGGVGSINDVARYSMTGVHDPTLNISYTNEFRSIIVTNNHIYGSSTIGYFAMFDLQGNLISIQNDFSQVRNSETIPQDNAMLIYGIDGLMKINLSDIKHYPNYGYGGGPADSDPTASTGVSAIHYSAYGKIIVLGSFEYYNQYPSSHIVQLNMDGTVDSSFTSPLDMYDNQNSITDVDVASDGSIFICGDLQIGGTEYNVLKLNPDGTLASGFTPVINNGYQFHKINVGPNGKIAYAESQQIVNVTHSYIRRLMPDGNPDPTFTFSGSINNGTISYVTDLEVRSDGKIFVSRTSDDYQGGSGFGVMAYEADGSYSTFFNNSYAIDPTYALYLDDQDRLYVGSYVSGEIDNFARFTSNDVLDPSYIENAGINFQVRAITELNDGKILLSEFASPSSRLKRLNLDGTLDALVSNTPVFVHNLLNDPNDNVLVAGNFDVFDTYAKSGLARLINDQPTLNPCYFMSVGTPQSQNIGCSALGSIELVDVYGQTPFSYNWPGTSFGNTDSVEVSLQGSYDVIITDNAGCTESKTVHIDAPDYTNGYDLSPYLVATTFRAGETSFASLLGTNDGCTSVNGQLTAVLSSNISYVNSSVTPDLISGDSIFWNFSNITFDNPMQEIVLELLTDFTANAGDSVFVDLIMLPDSTDSVASNNFKTYDFPVLDSYDPNDKAVYPKGDCIPSFIDTNQRLTYTVRFQNTGNASANNVLILDTISSFLDLNTVEIVSSKHTVQSEILSGNVLAFHFDNIMLPDSISDPTGSIGFVIFEINPIAGLTLGDEINNRVGIYFDFNPPIITNTVTNTISDGTHLSSSSSLVVATCDSLDWNGNTYFNSGIYSTILANQWGCDSTAILDLTIFKDSTFITTTALDSIVINGTTYDTSGVFQQTLIGSDGCDSILVIDLSVDYTSVYEFYSHDVKIYPNPAKEFVTIQFNNKKPFGIQVVNIEGRELYSSTNIVDDQFRLNTSHFQSGTYLLLISFQDQLVRLPILIE